MRNGIKAMAGHVGRWSFVLVLLCSGAVAQAPADLPDAPSTVLAAQQDSQPRARFFSFGRWDDARPLRTNREVLHSKTFMLAHGAFLLSIVADAEITHAGLAHHKCAEGDRAVFSPHPSRGELYKDNLTGFAVTSTLDFVVTKYMFAPLGLIAPVYGTQLHLRGAASWLANCW